MASIRIAVGMRYSSQMVEKADITGTFDVTACSSSVFKQIELSRSYGKMLAGMCSVAEMQS